MILSQKKQGGIAHFTPGKAISPTADESDSDKDTELSAHRDSESENHSDEMDTSDDDGNISENNSGQFENFVSQTKR